MKNPTFRKIVHTKISSVKSMTPDRKRRKTRLISVRNHNHLLWNFDGTLGGKTGYTRAAQKCFVGAVERNGVILIVSILGSHSLWGDTRRLLEYGFENYDTLELASQSTPAAQSPERSDTALAVAVASEEEEKQESDVEGYVLQVASFREADRAKSLLKTYYDKGFSAYVEKAALEEGEATYRVRIGPYTELLEAQEMAQEILDESGNRPLIVPVPGSHEVGDNGS